MCGYTRSCCLCWCCCCVATLRFVWSARRFNVPLFTVIATACCCGICGVCGVWRVCIELEDESKSKSKSFDWLTDLSYVCGICKLFLWFLLLLLWQLLSFINYDKSLRMRGQRRRQRRAAIFINFCKSTVCPSSAPARLRTTPRPL